jgi:hypothetical protein
MILMLVGERWFEHVFLKSQISPTGQRSLHSLDV